MKNVGIKSKTDHFQVQKNVNIGVKVSEQKVTMAGSKRATEKKTS